MNVMNVVSSPSLATSPMYFDYQTRLPLSSPRSEVMYLKPTANNISVPQGHVGCHTSFTGPVTSTTDTPTNRMSIIQVREIALSSITVMPPFSHHNPQKVHIFFDSVCSLFCENERKRRQGQAETEGPRSTKRKAGREECALEGLNSHSGVLIQRSQ